MPKLISVLEMPSSVFRKAMATKTTPTKPTEMATAEMTAATCKMAATTTEASTMAAPSSAMAAASSAVSECGGGRDRQNTGQNQTGKETVK
jgi:hypothetical protein